MGLFAVEFTPSAWFLLLLYVILLAVWVDGG